MLLFINVTLKWCPRRWGRSRPAVLARRVVGPPFRPESSDRVGMTKENMEGWKEGTEARNDEPRRGSKNRRAFRETTAAAVGERGEKKIRAGVRRRRARGEEKGHRRAIREARRRWKGRAEGLEAAEIVP